MKKFALGFAAALVAAATVQVQGARADDVVTGPMIEVGGGLQSALRDGGTNFLLRVGFGIRRTDGAVEPGNSLAPEQLVLAHISANVAFGSDGGHSFPYADIRFIPLESQINLSNENGNALLGNLQVLPIAVGRDVNLDEAVTVRVSVVGVQFGVVRAQTDRVALFAQVAADALGYKMASHLSDLATFHGVHLTTVGAEGGAVFAINGNFAIRVSVGGTADINWWGTRFQSDMRAYVAIRLDITRFLQVFAQASLNGGWDSSGGGLAGGPEAMVGITFLY